MTYLITLDMSSGERMFRSIDNRWTPFRDRAQEFTTLAAATAAHTALGYVAAAVTQVEEVAA